MRKPPKNPTAIRCLVLDIDGVLTDGSDALSGGDKRIYLRDIDALGRARREGTEVAFLTGEDEGAAREIVDRCGGGHALFGMKDKAGGIRTLAETIGIPTEKMCFLADADRDVPAMELAGLALAPADASPLARAAAHRVLTARGGRGAVEQAVALLLGSALGAGNEAEAAVRKELAGAADSIAAFAAADLAALLRMIQMLADCIAAGGRVAVFGNGGSAALAQHFAAELVGRFAANRGPFPAVALTTDTSVLTALANDFGYEGIFERQVEATVQYGDAVVGMSTSGNSANVVRGLAAARRLGARTVALVGADAGEVGKEAEICVVFQADGAARIQELHLLALHVVCGRLEELLPGPPATGFRSS